jgi:hypothetical protein
MVEADLERAEERAESGESYVDKKKICNSFYSVLRFPFDSLFVVVVFDCLD